MAGVNTERVHSECGALAYEYAGHYQEHKDRYYYSMQNKSSDGFDWVAHTHIYSDHSKNGHRGAERIIISTCMLDSIKMSVVATVWTVYQLLKPTVIILLVTVCIRPFII